MYQKFLLIIMKYGQDQELMQKQKPQQKWKKHIESVMTLLVFQKRIVIVEKTMGRYIF